MACWRYGAAMTDDVQMWQMPQQPKRSRWPVVAGLVTVAVSATIVGIALARGDEKAQASTTPSSTLGMTMNVRGSVKLTLGQFAYTSNPLACGGLRGYDDLQPGSQVTITDEVGTVVGVGAITLSVPDVAADLKSAKSCTLIFEVNGVRRGATHYGVTIGHRQPVQTTEQELLQDGLELAIG